MYSFLENEYKNRSLVKAYRYLILLIIICSLIGLCFLEKKCSSLSNDLLACTMISLYIFLKLLLIHIIHYVMLLISKRINNKNWWVIFNPIKCLHDFFDLEYKLDVETLFKCLIDIGIDNKDKIKVAIDHYNSLISKKSSSLKGSFFSLVAILITISTYISNDGIHFNENKLYMILLVIVALSFFYLMLWAILKLYYEFFSMEEFYLRIEEGLSEIYFNYEYYKNKSIKKILLIEYNKEILYNYQLESSKYKIEIKNVKENYNCNDYSKVFIFRFRDKLNKYIIYNKTQIEDNKYITSNVNIKTEELTRLSIELKNRLCGKKVNNLFFKVLESNKNALFIDIPSTEMTNINQILSLLINEK